MAYNRLLDLGSLWRESTQDNDPKSHLSVDVPGHEYPNHDILPDYTYQQFPIPGFGLIIYGGSGVGIGTSIGMSYGLYKYRNKLGYRDLQLIERLCMPLIKSSVAGLVLGLGVGVLFEVQRIANENYRSDYNSKMVK